VSGGEPIVNRFVGAGASYILFPEEDWGSLTAADLPFYLFTPKQVARLFQADPKEADFSQDTGYMALTPRPDGTYSTLKGFRIRNGRVVYDPDGSARKNAVSMVSGTSAAAPFALGKAVHRKFCLKNAR
jgi:hypothetical protein